MKNKFLLLSATVIISTGAVAVNAEFEYPTLDIAAQAEFVTSITVESFERMVFGVVDPRGGGTVTIDLDNDSISGTAKMIFDSPTHLGKVEIAGVKGFYDSWGNGSEYIRISIPNNAEITLYEDEAHSTGECATVSGLGYRVGEYDSSETGKLTVYFAGTLNVDSDYIPTGGYSSCTGKTTVTFVLSDD